MDGVEEGGVIGGSVGGDLAVEEVDVAGSGDDACPDVVSGGEGGVVAIDDRAGRDFDAGAWWKAEGDAGIYIERDAEVDGGSGASGFRFRGQFRDAELREQGWNADGFFRPVDEFGLRDLVFDGERKFRGGRVRGTDRCDVAAQSVG